MIRRLWCRWFGHLWAKARVGELGGYTKRCRRCGETRVVQRRAK